jgi:NTP pyrophosphatase (non-canonical NTP hydrolase)
MDLAEFSRKNRERCTSALGFNHRLESWSVAEWTNAIAGELGEAANLTTKLLRHRDGVPGNHKPEDLDTASLRRRAAQELADAVIYADLAVQALGLDLTDVIREAFNAKSEQLGCGITV